MLTTRSVIGLLPVGNLGRKVDKTASKSSGTSSSSLSVSRTEEYNILEARKIDALEWLTI